MGLFRRGRRRDEEADDDSLTADVAESAGDAVETITAAPLGEPERSRIAAALDELSSAGVDVDDLASLEAEFDAAVDRGDPSVLPLLAVGVGEHLDRHADLRWAVVTDSFGRDLGLQGSRRDLHVVPDSLLSARWMRREKGWLERTVRHLVDTSAR